jgi:competence ComEA-like helix-hairpin-helix protein
MIKRALILFALFFLIHFALSQCNSDQIDVNTASLTDLDKLTGIGATKAQAIIDARPYSTLDDLDKAVGIGPSTLDKIKQQGLACVDSGEIVTNTQQTNTQPKEEVIIEESDPIRESQESIENTREVEMTESSTIADTSGDNRLSESIINLNSDIQTKEVVVYESKNELIRKYAIWAFSIVLVFVIIILLVKK